MVGDIVETKEAEVILRICWHSPPVTFVRQRVTIETLSGQLFLEWVGPFPVDEGLDVKSQRF